MVSLILDTIVRVSLLLAAAALVATALRRGPASVRHLVWTIALAGSVALPVVTLIGARWELPLLPAGIAQSASVSSAGSAVSVSAPRPARSARSAVKPDSARSAVRSNPAISAPSAVSLRSALFLWLAGALIVLIRFAAGTLRMWWIARRARAVGAPWMRLAESLAASLGVRQRVIFLEGARTAMPMAWGLFKARVLLPASARHWPTPRQRVVLLHELAHVKRRDCLAQLLAQAACAMYWFNPLAWLAARRLRVEREHACDDMVLTAGTRGSEYADHLLEIARAMRSAALPTWGAVAMAHRSQLEGRLMAILDPDVPRRVASRRHSAAIATTVLTLAVPIAVLTPVPKAAARDTVVTAAATPRVSTIAQPAPAGAPQEKATVTRSTQGELPSILRDAVKDAVPDAVRDLAKEGRIPPLAAEALEAIGFGLGEGIGQGVGQAVGGVRGGVQGGVADEQAEAAPSARRDPRVVAALVEALKDSDKEVRESAMQALAGMRAPEAIEAIRAALKDSNASVREQAALALGQYRDRASVGALTSALQDDSANVREQAVFALGQIRDRAASPALLGALKDSSANVREQAAFALGQFRDPESVQPLIAVLKDPSQNVREQAAFALGQIRDRRAVEALVASLQDENAGVREQAAFALGQLRDPRAIDGLTAALKDRNAEVRQQAAFALGQIAK